MKLVCFGVDSSMLAAKVEFLGSLRWSVGNPSWLPIGMLTTTGTSITPRLPLHEHKKMKHTAEECSAHTLQKTGISSWTVFPCKHATCCECYQTLCKGPAELCLCPLCRLALMIPLEGACLFLPPHVDPDTLAHSPWRSAQAKAPVS